MRLYGFTSIGDPDVYTISHRHLTHSVRKPLSLRIQNAFITKDIHIEMMEKKFKRTTVTSALPYANGPVHIGHLAGVYVPADIYVRYLRLKKEDVIFIGGSDEHADFHSLFQSDQQHRTPAYFYVEHNWSGCFPTIMCLFQLSLRLTYHDGYKFRYSEPDHYRDYTKRQPLLFSSLNKRLINDFIPGYLFEYFMTDDF